MNLYKTIVETTFWDEGKLPPKQGMTIPKGTIVRTGNYRTPTGYLYENNSVAHIVEGPCKGYVRMANIGTELRPITALESLAEVAE